jgi:hypothetical protein
MNSISFDKYGITFEVGNKEYTNALGTYKVTKIEDGKLFVKYLSVKNVAVNTYATYVYDAEGQAASMHKMKMEIERPSLKRIHKRLHNLPKVSDKWDFTLGYLAANGYIQIEVGPNSMDTFPQDFKVVTKRNVDEFEGKGYHSNPTLNKYTYSMSIRLSNTSEDILHLLDIPTNITKTDNGIFIHSNDFIWSLLNAGFLPGNNWGNADYIKTKNPKEIDSDFVKGFCHEEKDKKATNIYHT